ncbi:A/G-specific adenine glycosylase [Sulfurimonas aquatica]|uniref:A/G-specific adenine glycosylase n=1 Tax=Sulfurimonas aquatica TaxID=2672570 RepID=UPI001F62209C|nr:A/G-specific adenine glycosylase [Sulfurimonas aquatica]
MNRFKSLQSQLLKWYKIHGRHELPWRNTNDMYHIYLSEIMLQQTQVNRVRDEYYPQFLERFPSLEILANAKQDEVLSAWSGLGYYSRARNLHKTAIASSFALPTTQKELIKLPGIGRYTASAICSFGHNQNIPVVDTNIARVIKRVFALMDTSEKIVWSHAEEFVNATEPRHHNLALMDLGSLVCLPKNPKCDECPLSSFCKGKTEPELYTQTKKTVYESLELFYGVLIEEEKIALKYSKEKLYKDMLVLPSVDPIEENLLGEFKHSYTKYRLNVKLYEIQDINDEKDEIVWINLKDFKNAAISSLTKKASKFFID